MSHVFYFQLSTSAFHSIDWCFFPLLEPFFIDIQLLVLVCCPCYFYSLIFFSLSNMDSHAMFFTSNYPQAHSIQLTSAFFSLLEPFFIDAQLLVLVCCLCYFYSLIFFFHFLTWTHVPCFLLPIVHRCIPFN